MTNMNLLGKVLVVGLAAVTGTKVGVAAYSIAEEKNKAKEYESNLTASGFEEAWIPCGEEAKGFLIEPVRKVAIPRMEDEIEVNEDQEIIDVIFEEVTEE